MEIKGVQGTASFDGEWITITKRVIGQQTRTFRLRASEITGTRLKPATRLLHGYLQFVLPGSRAAAESDGLLTGGRPPHSDPHSLSIPRRSNGPAKELMAAVEAARS